jgi:hypothetical protein
MDSDRGCAPRNLAAFLLGAGLLLAAVPASAAPTPAERETARALMDSGDKKFAAKDFAGALSAYQGADAIMKVPSTGAAVARTQAALGLLVEARDSAVLVTRIPLEPGAPKPFVKAHAEAEKLERDLASRIPSIQISVDGPPPSADLNVTLDGTSVPPSMLTLPSKVDPGKHVLHASAAGFSDVTNEVTLQEGENANVKLTLVALPAAKPVAEAPPSSRAPVVDTGLPADAPPSHVSPLVYVGFGVGAAGIGVGAVTGILHLSKVSSIKTEYCNGGTACSAGFEDPVSSAKTLATVSDIAFVVGAVGVGVGVYGLFASKHQSTSSASAKVPPAGAWVSPTIGIGSAGLEGGF